jgi:hypothetical protein
MRSIWVLTWLALACAGAGAQSLPPGANRTLSNATLPNARQSLHSYPAQITPQEYGAAGDAIRAYGTAIGLIAGTNNLLSLAATYTLDNVAIVCTAGTKSVNLTFPSGITIPYAIGGNYIGNFRILLPGCGTSGATQNTYLNGPPSGSGSGPYTITTGDNIVTTFSGAGSVIIYANSFSAGNNTTSQNATWQFYREGTGSISGATITMPTNTFNGNNSPGTVYVRDLSQANASGLQQTYIAIDDPNGVCPEYRGLILQATSTTFANLSSAPPCPGGSWGSTLSIWWGTLLFPANVATGPTKAGVPWQCEIPGVGASGTASILPIGSYIDPFHVMVSGTTQTTVNQLTGALTCGTPDDTALDNAAQAAINAGYSSMYLVPGSNYIKTNGSQSYLNTLSLCADGMEAGRIFWPQAYPELRNGAPCTPTQGLPSARRTIDPNVHLRHAQSVTGTVRVGFFGDSLFYNGSNNMGAAGSGDENISTWLSYTLGKPVTSYPYNIGGMSVANLAPTTGVVLGGSQGVGIPPAINTGTVATWYTSNAQKWIDYGKNACWDVVFLEFQNDGYNFMLSTFWDVNGYIVTQWQSSCGFVPDIIWATGPGQSSTATAIAVQEATLYNQDAIRTLVLAGDTMPPGVSMPAGRAVGLLDFNNSYFRMTKGYDFYNPPMTRAVAVVQPGSPANTGPQIKLPYTWPRPVRDFQFVTGFGVTSPANATASQLFGNYGNTIDFPLGNGSSGTPYSVNGQSTPLQVGYPNNMMQLYYDSGTGNYGVTGFDFLIVEAATCSITSGSSSLVCTNPVANVGHYYSSISITGPGASTCPALVIAGSNCLNTTIAAGGVSADGKTLTLASPATVTISAASANIAIYHLFLTSVASNIPVSINATCSPCNVNNGLGFSLKGPFLTINNQFFNAQPIFQGPVVRFGSRFQPIIYPGSQASYGGLSPSNQRNLPAVNPSAENADDVTLFTPTMPNDYRNWGMPPGYSSNMGGGWNAHMSYGGMVPVMNNVLAANDFRATIPAAALAGTTGSIGGSALAAGSCATGTVTINGATTSMQANASPVTFPGGSFNISAFVSGANTATVEVCAAITGTPTASAYNVRVLQ